MKLNIDTEGLEKDLLEYGKYLKGIYINLEVESLTKDSSGRKGKPKTTLGEGEILTEKLETKPKKIKTKKNLESSNGDSEEEKKRIMEKLVSGMDEE